MRRLLLGFALLLVATTAMAADLRIRVVGNDRTHHLRDRRMGVAFEVTNDLGAPARDVRIVVTVTPALTDQKLSDGWGWPCATPTQCGPQDIGPGKDAWASVSGIPSTPGTYVVTATVFASNDPDASNDTATYTFLSVDEPQLDVSLLGFYTFAQYDPEQKTNVTAAVFNSGSREATDVVMTIVFAPGTQILTVTPDARFTCEVAAQTVTCRAASIVVSQFDKGARVAIRITTPPLWDGGKMLVTASVTSREPDFRPEDNRESAEAYIVPAFIVTNSADDGPGSLRQAILDANAAKCRPHGCSVAFRIPGPLPEDGFFTIRPRAPLPALRWTGTLKGSEQANFLDLATTTPVVMLDGSLQSSGDGLTTAEWLSIVGLALGNFPASALFAEGGELSFRQSYAGLDPRGRAAPNDRGLVASNGTLSVWQSVVSANRRSGIVVANGNASVTQSRIGVAPDSDAPLPNGASGIFLSAFGSASIEHNVIAHHPHFAIAIHTPEHRQIDISRNRLFGNGVEIDYGLDGPTPNSADDSQRFPNHPEIVSAAYDPIADRTTITVRVQTWSRPPLYEGWNPNGYPFVFYSATADLEVFANARYAGRVSVGPLAIDRATLLTGTLQVSGDLRGQTLTAVTRRYRADCYTDVCRYWTDSSETSPELVVR